MKKLSLIWIIFFIACVALMVYGTSRDTDIPNVSEFTIGMSIKQIAPQLNVTGKNLARELGLPLKTGKGQPVRNLGITQEELDHSVEHLLGHRETFLKYYIFVGLVFFGLIYLVKFGRIDGPLVPEQKNWYPRWPYIATLVMAVLITGFALGKSPNPMESSVKVFKSFIGLYPSIIVKVVAFSFFAILAVIGNKLICGWACPFGALQELIYHLPILRKLKKRKVLFVITNTIRGALFVVMLLLLFGIVGGRKGFVIYHFINPFNLFNLDIETFSVGATIFIALVLSFGFYRPFCQFICPFGFLSWLLERLSIFRVRIDHEKCNECQACVKACPLDAAKGLVAGKVFHADCFSCARCLNVCPNDAIRYEFIGKKFKVQSEHKKK